MTTESPRKDCPAGRRGRDPDSKSHPSSKAMTSLRSLDVLLASPLPLGMREWVASGQCVVFCSMKDEPLSCWVAVVSACHSYRWLHSNGRSSISWATSGLPSWPTSYISWLSSWASLAPCSIGPGTLSWYVSFLGPASPDITVFYP